MDLPIPRTPRPPLVGRIPEWLIALISRVAAASTFWTTGQAKLDAPVVDVFRLRFEVAWPRLSETGLELFGYLYRFKLPALEAIYAFAAIAEHLFAALLLIGLATRLSAIVLLCITIGIEFWVYPEAYATYALWVASLIYLIARGPGRISVDQLLDGRMQMARASQRR